VAPAILEIIREPGPAACTALVRRRTASAAASAICRSSTLESSARAARISGANKVTYLSDQAKRGAITASGMGGVRFSSATKR
jgi:hypothetical protein